MENKTCNNTHPCECTNTACQNHGKCCACVAFHKGKGNVPNCLRPKAQ